MKNDKETAVYEGVIELIRRGEDIYAVKVSDIAAAAGIGKGTVYEYFSSKEEILAKAVVYCLRKSILAVKRAMDGKEGFQQKYFAVLDSVGREADHGMMLFEVLSAGMGTQKLQQYLCGAPAIEENMHTIYEIADGLLTEGKKEGLISATEDAYYNRMTIYSSIVGYCVYQKNARSFPDVDAAHAKESAYRMMVRAL